MGGVCRAHRYQRAEHRVADVVVDFDYEFCFAPVRAAVADG
jgi:hypothetical protein